MIAETLSGLPTEILGHYFGKIADFLGSELTGDLDWKIWKAKNGFAENKSDFPERYAEMLLALKNTGKPQPLLKFYTQDWIFTIIHNLWYGDLSKDKFHEQFEYWSNRFTLDKQLESFSSKNEIADFLTAFSNAVNQNRTAGETDLFQKIIEIWNVVANKEKESTQVIREIHTSRLPDTADRLFGRDNELAILDSAWNDPHTHLVEIIAWGGMGKTALVREWLNRLAMRNYDDAPRVYAWPFYRQGAGDYGQSTAESFILDMLKWFGEDETKLPLSLYERGKLLVQHIRRQRTLLILDGLEPLQYPPGELEGQLKDHQGLRTILRDLASHNNGLCVLTSRIAVKDLAAQTQSTVNHVPLERLDSGAGADLLEYLNVKGKRKDLEAASEDYKGHALALRLLGNYLASLHGGDLRKKDKIKKLTEEENLGGHARRVMDAYVHWFEQDDKYTPDLTLLYLIGLFDRPAPLEAINAVLASEAFQNLGVFGKLAQLPPEKQTLALRHLEKLNLFTADRTNGLPLPPGQTHERRAVNCNNLHTFVGKTAWPR